VWDAKGATDHGFAIGSGLIAVGTKRYAEVPVTIEVNPVDPGFSWEGIDRVSEGSITVTTRLVVGMPISASMTAVPDVAPGIYAVRSLASGLGTVTDDWHGDDRYVVQLWPAVAEVPVRHREKPVTGTMIEIVEMDESDPSHLRTRWKLDAGFLGSNWSCRWGNGCHGIDTERRADLALGCCSVGAVLDGDDEANLISASAAALTAEQFQYIGAARTGGVFTDETRAATRVVDGACIFLNRPGFAGGNGCALDIAAAAAGESRIDWKPSVCWQLPIRTEFTLADDGVEDAIVRAWARDDWGDEGPTMAWCCTERVHASATGGNDDAYVGTAPVVETMREELTEMLGETVYLELRAKLGR
jgi:hypothetical protein